MTLIVSAAGDTAKVVSVTSLKAHDLRETGGVAEEATDAAPYHQLKRHTRGTPVAAFVVMFSCR